MPNRILLADNTDRDADRIRSVLDSAETVLVVCKSIAEAEHHLQPNEPWAALVVLWEFPGPPSPPRGAELLSRAKQLLPEVPVIVVTNSVDAHFAVRAHALGACDVIEKPLDLERVKLCLATVLSEQAPELPRVLELNETIIGSSPQLLNALREVAKVAGHHDASVLLVGESGTGKEMIAQALHRFGPSPEAPFTAINIAAFNPELIESAMFGHEKGAFTGAIAKRIGWMEQAGGGSLLLDEIGDLDDSAQVKLLRAIQERRFFRVGGTDEIEFEARLICATSRNLALAVRQNAFKDALYHRIAGVQIELPPLRDRDGDIDLLLNHFLKLYGKDRSVGFARETLRALNSYHFPGNVRELAHFVERALITCTGPFILPRHLPLPTMGIFLGHSDAEPQHATNQVSARLEDGNGDGFDDRERDLLQELEKHLPPNWRELPYKQVRAHYLKAFDRVYFPAVLNRHHHNVGKSSEAVGMDHKTFNKHLRDAELLENSSHESS